MNVVRAKESSLLGGGKMVTKVLYIVVGVGGWWKEETRADRPVCTISSVLSVLSMLVQINRKKRVNAIRSKGEFYLPDDVSVDRLFDVDVDRALAGG